MLELSLGIDPGWTNLGAAIVQETEETWRVNILRVFHENPSKARSAEEFTETFYNQVGTKSFHLVIERYVAYAGINTANAEDIAGLIGMLRMAAHLKTKPLDVRLVRAIEWKTSLVKLLSRYTGFVNPPDKKPLGKVFSLAAARHLSTNPELIINDHQADAVCMAALPILERRLRNECKNLASPAKGRRSA